ncbi:MAG: PAS domain-containing sensor histidine kinase [Bernardetiaceae bacterium]|jgi:PAS domain S-box-containing protein|nr:PAS domain-containing sensor histidine kinase [Bernardetiaceae bacterium]
MNSNQNNEAHFPASHQLPKPETPQPTWYEATLNRRAAQLGLDQAAYRQRLLNQPSEFYDLLADLQVQNHLELVEKAEALQTYQAELKTSIEELQIANIAVIEREEYLKAVIEGAEVAIITLDRYGFITSYNNFAAKLFGYEKFEVIGKPILKLLSQASKKDVSHYLSRIVTQDKNSAFKGRIHALAKDNTEVITEFAINPVHGNQKTYFVVVLTDVTSTVLYSEKARQQNEQLQKMNVELDRFLYGVSHDLKAPVNNLAQMLDKTLFEANPKIQGEQLAAMHRILDRLTDFVDDIVTYTHQARADLRPGPVDFFQTAYEVWHSLADEPGHGQIDFRVALVSETDDTFYSDPDKLKVVFASLFANAIQYRRAEAAGELVLAVEMNDRRAILKVADNGIGIPEVHLPLIFDMFYRAEPSYSEGTGLGLYMAKEAVARLQGSIRVESEAGRGATFVIGLPNLKVEQG